MPGYDPSRDGPYGEWLRNKGVQTNTGTSAPRVREFVDEHGRRRRTLTERTDSGALTVTTQRTDERGGTHQDVHIHAPAVTSVGQVIVP